MMRGPVVVLFLTAGALAGDDAGVDRRKERDTLEALVGKLKELTAHQHLITGRAVDKVGNTALREFQEHITLETSKVAKTLGETFASRKEVELARTELEKAREHQRVLEKAITLKNKTLVGKEQEAAVKSLREARKVLEEEFERAVRHERNRLMANLRRTCEGMAVRQAEIHKSTLVLAKAIDAAANKKATVDQIKEASKLAEQQKHLVADSTQAIRLLKEEAVSGALTEVFQQIREDAKAVESRLQAADVGSITQLIQKDIVETLKEMSAALAPTKGAKDKK